jgi:hypothetical protein
MVTDTDITNMIMAKLKSKKDVKTVYSERDGADIVFTSADGRKMLIEFKSYAAPDAIDVIELSNLRKQQAAAGAILASGTTATGSAFDAAAKLNVGILSQDELLRDIEQQPLQYLFQLGTPRVPSESALIDTATTDLSAHGWRTNEAFTQIIIVPNGAPAKIPRRDLDKMIESCTVKISGYGGPYFPFSRTYPGVTEIHHADGFGLLDDQAWPYEDWSFRYWYFTEYGYFITRRHLSEEHMADVPRGTLSLEWLQLDIARALLFARNLQTKVENNPEMRVKFQLHGMKGRKLFILNRGRAELVGNYIASDDDVATETQLGKESDLVETGMEMLVDTVWRFGWRDPPEQVLRKDITTLISGRFPS